MLPRTRLFVAAIVVIAAGCSTAPGGSAGWSYGPSLPPGSPVASGAPSSAPSVAPSAAATASAVPSVAPSAAASPSATSGDEATELTIGTDTDAELKFDPATATVPSGARVKITFENRASLPHNMTFGDPINAATDPIVDPGSSKTVEFTAPAPGEYPWHCTIHPAMQGTLTVGPAG